MIRDLHCRVMIGTVGKYFDTPYCEGQTTQTVSVKGLAFNPLAVSEKEKEKERDCNAFPHRRNNIHPRARARVISGREPGLRRHRHGKEPTWRRGVISRRIMRA